MNIARTVLTAAALVGAATSANAATNIVTNGNFDAGLSGFAETPGPEIDVANGAVYAGCCNVSGLNGDNNNNFATFGGGGQPDISTLSQVLGTVVGQSYVLSFRATALGSGTAGFQAQVLNGSTLLGTLTTTVTAGAPYITYLLGFIAQSTSTTIAFSASGNNGSIDPILDDVVVVAVPEPATWALMILGFGIVGSALRRRRRTQVRFNFA